jgi:hypothetical protein
MAPSLLRSFQGPFKVFEKIGKVTYHVELLYHMRVHHPVFHIIQLKPFQTDADDPSRVEPSQAPTMISNKPKSDVEKILAHEIMGVGRNQQHEYFVLWRGKPDSENSWERYKSLWKYEDLIREYDRRKYRSQKQRMLPGRQQV